MHIVLAVLGALGAGAFWWYRMKMIGGAAKDIADAAGKARGAYRRHQFKKKADAATLDAIDDPRLAAMVLFAAIATSDSPMSTAQESAIVESARNVLGVDNPQEDLVFAKWAVADVADINSLVTRLSKLWTARLDMSERAQLYALAKQIAEL